MVAQTPSMPAHHIRARRNSSLLSLLLIALFASLTSFILTSGLLTLRASAGGGGAPVPAALNLQAKCGDDICDAKAGENYNNCSLDCKPVCGNAVCEADEASSCPEDCKPTGPVCGNGSCESGEDPRSCPSDCKPVCGNGSCESGEDPWNCNADCKSVCGNFSCEPGEDVWNCSSDCKPVCGNTVCEPGEDASNCIIDCPKPPTLPICGNNICEGDEATTCPKDCAPPTKCGDGYCDPDIGENFNTCSLDCKPECGNAVCEADEATTCPKDCQIVIGWCGDGRCSANESYDTCSKDCTKPVCGNDFCETGEDANTCSTDCRPVCGNALCELGEPTSCPKDCPITIGFCGDGRCASNENYDICPKDCAKPVCGNSFCETGEDAVSCAGDCKPVCGNAVCEPGETRSSCSKDCPITIGWCGDGRCASNENIATCPKDCPLLRPTLTPTPTEEPTEAPIAGPSVTPRPDNQPGSDGGGDTSDSGGSSTQEAQPTGEAPPELNAGQQEGDVPVIEVVPVEEITLPPNCRVESLANLPGEVAAALEEMGQNLLLSGDSVVICDRQAREVCIPYEGPRDDDVEIVSCTTEGVCTVYAATYIEWEQDGGTSAACVERRLGRRMPRCKGGCVAATGLKVTPPDLVTGYVIPISMVLSAITIGAVGFVFVLGRRKRSLEIDEEDALDEGLVTRDVHIRREDDTLPHDPAG